MSGPRLWVSDEPRRYFLVPPEAELPPGDLVIRTLEAASRSVDPEALAAFEVERTAAQAHVDAGWERAVGRVRDAWRELVGAPKAEGPPDLSRIFGRRTPGEVVLGPEAEKLGATVRRQAERIGAATRELGQELDARAPELQRTVEDVGQDVVDLGKRALAGLRGFARKATIPDEEPPGDEGAP